MFETTIHWVQDITPHRLGLMARPRGGESLCEEIASWQRASVGMVVSLLESHEIRELELREEASLCAERGIAFRQFPIPDRSTPRSQREVRALIAELTAELASARSVAIHCRAGIGRTGLIAGCVLHALGVPEKDIFRLLSRSRGVAMPDTTEQADWVRKYALDTIREQIDQRSGFNPPS
ncbi:tyrosine-protein phosphatase [Variovorax sp. 770b2]|jgi:protein-tyrosine phosphatase|uniref:protein-tyrosine phosphatase family protein n=1 Tax=Variovorax sp. 770b2 TaxID=1566271 RepID=UPI000B81B87B|nr:tyrosine-protein phosphatase [Variovorax sp. 770b2]